MLDRIFPKTIDNSYRGHIIGLWLYVPVVLVKLAMAGNSLLNPGLVLARADGIPLERYGDNATAFLALFTRLALSNLMLALLALVVLVRYRAMIGFMFLLLLIQQGGARVLNEWYPIQRSESGVVGTYINLALLGALALGFVLSLLGKRAPKA